MDFVRLVFNMKPEFCERFGRDTFLLGIIISFILNRA
jgi:hypothetical protein